MKMVASLTEVLESLGFLWKESAWLMMTTMQCGSFDLEIEAKTPEGTVKHMMVERVEEMPALGVLLDSRGSTEAAV